MSPCPHALPHVALKMRLAIGLQGEPGALVDAKNLHQGLRRPPAPRSVVDVLMVVSMNQQTRAQAGRQVVDRGKSMRMGAGRFMRD